MQAERTPTYNYRDPFFSKSVMISALAHGLFGVILTVRAIFFTTEPIDYQRAVRVDLVGLPDKILTPPSEPANEKPEQKLAEKPIAKPLEKTISEGQPPPKELVEKKVAQSPTLPTQVAPKIVKKESISPKINFEKNKTSQKSAIERLKALEKLQALEEQQKIEAGQARKQALEQFKYKGNVISAGTSLKGVNKLQHDAYIDQVDAHVKKYWSLPEWLANGKYQARVLVKINDKGFVTEVVFLKKSQNPIFDEKIIETIKNASPFPEPPEKFQNILSVDGIRLGFPE